MAYVDGFVFAVPKKNRAAYLKMAKVGKRMFTKLGAIDYKECRMDDPKPPMVTRTFPKLVKPRDGEEIWFSYVVYKNKKTRDVANKKMSQMMDTATEAEKKMFTTMPFDMKRMAVGGFTVEVG